MDTTSSQGQSPPDWPHTAPPVKVPFPGTCSERFVAHSEAIAQPFVW